MIISSFFFYLPEQGVKDAPQIDVGCGGSCAGPPGAAGRPAGRRDRGAGGRGGTAELTAAAGRAAPLPVPGLTQRGPVIGAVREGGQPAGVRVTGEVMLGVIRVVVLPAVVVVVVTVCGFGVHLSVRRLRGTLGLGFAPCGCGMAPLLAAGRGEMAQGSARADVAVRRPEGVVWFSAAVERGGTVVVLMVMLTSPDL